MNAQQNPFSGAVDEVREKKKASRERVRDLETDMMKDRARFFERLALLSGSALTLSATLLGQLVAKQTAPAHPHLLHAAWIFLLISVLSPLARNHFHDHYRLRGQTAPYYEVLVDEALTYAKYLISGGQLWNVESMRVMSLEDVERLRETADQRNNQVEQLKREASRYWIAVKTLELITWVGLISGLTLIVAFSIFNTWR